MFHWICPECGREIPPAVKECPACDPQAAAVAVPELPPVVPLAAASLPAPAISPYPAAEGRAAPSRPALEVSELASLPPPIPNFAPPPLASAAPPILVPRELPAPQAVETAVGLLEPPPLPEPLLPEPPVLDEPQAHWPPDFTKRTQALLPRPQLPLLLAAPASGGSGFTQILLPLVVPSEMALPAEVLIRPPDLAALADAVDHPVAAEAPAPQPPAPHPPIASRVALPPLRVVPWRPAQVPANSNPVPEPAAPAVVDLVAPTLELRPPAPPLAENQFRLPNRQAIQTLASAPAPPADAATPFEATPGNPIRPSLRPASGPALAGLVKYSTAALRRMRAARPARSWFVAQLEPRITLPGPALPKELHSLAQAGLRPILDPPRAPRRRSGVGVLWTALAAVVVIAVLLLAGLNFLPPELLSGKTPAVQADTAAAVADAAPVTPRPAARTTYPLSKTIEVTGIRFVVDLNGKSEIHYLVVNHSAAQFGAVTVYVTLRGVDAKPGQAPVARFSFRAPDLGPYGSREMTSPIEKISRQVSLPDWQDLHAYVEIAD